MFLVLLLESLEVEVCGFLLAFNEAVLCFDDHCLTLLVADATCCKNFIPEPSLFRFMIFPLVLFMI